MATRTYEHPANGQRGQFTERAARRFGLIPVEEIADAPESVVTEDTEPSEAEDIEAPEAEDIESSETEVAG